MIKIFDSLTSHGATWAVTKSSVDQRCNPTICSICHVLTTLQSSSESFGIQDGTSESYSSDPIISDHHLLDWPFPRTLTTCSWRVRCRSASTLAICPEMVRSFRRQIQKWFSRDRNQSGFLVEWFGSQKSRSSDSRTTVQYDGLLGDNSSSQRT